MLGTIRLLRGPWPAKSRKEARVFPLLQPAAIVEKVNTPHSLTGKSSSQEWKEIKSLFQPRLREPTRAVCAAGAALGTPKQGPILIHCQHPLTEPFSPGLLSSGHCPPPSVWSYWECWMRQGKRYWGIVVLGSVPVAWCPSSVL